MELSIRLEALIEAVEPVESAADIGTDHGFLPIELIRRGKVQRMIACDVRSGPLERAKEHVKAAVLEEKIETRLADGLAGLRAGEVKAVVIAGMGGALMASILEKADPEVIASLDTLILQPQSEFSKLRHQVEILGFEPVKEKMVIDREKYYWIMVCHKKKQDLPTYTESWQKTYGKLLPEEPDEVFLEYLKKREQTAMGLWKDLSNKDGEAASRRRKELEAELEEIRAALAVKGRKHK